MQRSLLFSFYLKRFTYFLPDPPMYIFELTSQCSLLNGPKSTMDQSLGYALSIYLFISILFQKDLRQIDLNKAN